MEPRIQYAQTKDGVSIAFWTLGEGMPLVHTPPPFSHIQLEWQHPQNRQFFERLAQSRMLVRYDGRGMGLSERDVTDFSVDTFVLDLEAVVDHLSLQGISLFAPSWFGPGSIAYAARHPERVSHLVLWGSIARGSDIMGTPQAQGLLALMDKDWELFTETLAHVVFGWSAGEPAREYAMLMRESVPKEALQALVGAIARIDVTALLPQVRVPTLILHRRRLSYLAVDAARGLASRIPDARFTLLQGDSGAPYLGDKDAVLEAIDEFLGEGEESAPRAAPSGLVTILFTDMEGSTTLTQRIGDARAQEVLRAHNTIVRDALKAHGGSETKHTGDGIMASFPSASQALACAVAVQRAFADRNQDVGAPEPIRVRIGLNAGEPVAEEEDLFGTAVQLAARICAHAEPGQILASNVVQELAAGKDFAFADRGDVALKGFEKPVRLFEVRWREEGGP